MEHIPELVIVKTGTGVISNEARDQLDEASMQCLADQINKLDSDYEVGRTLLVSSAAITAGLQSVGHERPTNMSVVKQQYYASIGQDTLLTAWRNVLGRPASQILATHHELDSEEAWDNVSRLVVFALTQKTILIFNENDVFSTSELERMEGDNGRERKRFGDNDPLAAHIARNIGKFAMSFARQETGLYLATSTDGILDSSKRLITEMSTTEALKFAQGVDDSSASNGGMESKILSAVDAALSGANVVIFNGKEEGALLAAVDKEEVGTRIYVG